MPTRRALLTATATIAALGGLLAPAQGRQSRDLTGQHTDLQVVPLATGASLVRLIFDLNGWPAGYTYIVRHFCPPGVAMYSQGFSVLGQPRVPSRGGLRHYVRINNMRNLAGAAGEQGFSWYLQNDGEAAGPFRLELSFVASGPPAA